MAKLFSEAEVSEAKMIAISDPMVRDLCDTIQQLYLYNLPASVSVSFAGEVMISLSSVRQDIKNSLATQLRAYLADKYPALEIISTKKADPVNSIWRSPDNYEPMKGEYLVVTPHDYCIKAVYFGNGDWQCGDQDLKGVMLYANLLAAPEGMTYVNTK